METQPHPHHREHITIGILLSALVSATAFRYFFYDEQYSVALALFLFILLTGVHVLAGLAGGRGNLWAYLFLIPFGLSLAGAIMYSSEPVRGLSLIVSIASLTFFTFWFTAPRKSFQDLKSLWPFSLFLESFIPFTRLGVFGRELVRDRGSVSKVLVGAGIAVPFLLLFGLLFASADGVIRQTLLHLFTDQKQVWLFVNHAVWDIVAFIFFTSAGYTVVTRISQRRAPKISEDPEPFDAVVVNTFLVLLNMLFLGFIVVQFFTLFGGEAVLRSQELTYAGYARQGFFQLVAVAAIVLCIVAVLYRFMGLKQWLARILAAAFVLQTAVIIASAIRRLMLYVDAYGLTLSRYWAFAAIILITLGLSAMLIAMLMNMPHHRVFNTLFVASLVLVSCSMLFNAETFVVRVNANRFFSSTTLEFDETYVLSLSSDAIPALMEVYGERGANALEITFLRENLVGKLNDLRETAKNWRRATVSDYRALATLERLFAAE